jgi:putative transcriptional regulator
MMVPNSAICKTISQFSLIVLALLSSSILKADISTSIDTRPADTRTEHQIAGKPKDSIEPPPNIFGIPAKGKLLIASKKMQDPRFSETVVFLIEYRSTGAMGLIINRPTDVRLSELIKDLPALKKRQDVAFYGGPVESNRMFLLIRSMNSIEESSNVMEEVHMSTSRAILEQVVSGKMNLPFRSYAGYAGWAPGQLDAEIARGDWYVTKADAHIIFDRDPKKIWQELIRVNTSIQV